MICFIMKYSKLTEKQRYYNKHCVLISQLCQIFIFLLYLLQIFKNKYNILIQLKLLVYQSQSPSSPEVITILNWVLSLLYQSAFSRETKLTGCVYIHREGFILRNLLMRILEAWQVHNLQGRVAGCRQEKSSSSSPRAVCWQHSFLFGEGSLFLLRPSSDWMRPTLIMEGNLLYSKSTELNVNLI